MDDIRKDKRFADILRDPKFRKMPTIERKTKIDKRFQAMFDDEDFKLKYTMDKRGRPWKHNTSEDLKKFYAISSSSDTDDDEDQELNHNSKEDFREVNAKEESEPSDKDVPRIHDAKSDHLNTIKHSKQFHEDSVTKKETAIRKSKLRDKEKECKKSDENVIAKDDDDESSDNDDKEGIENEDSSEDDSSSDELGVEDDLDDEFDHKWEELDAEAPLATEATRRLAVCNMDWDRIRAEDMLAVFNSFKPGGSVIHSVKIYPSEFGLKRMEEEKLRGPTELVSDNPKTDDIDDDKPPEKSGYHREKLRQYQINRLKYFYAVVECDSPATANALYEQLNGMEYESSAVCMDIRFIPDDMVFDQDPKSVATSVPDPSRYKPRLFVNSALQQVKVNLTWDETDPARHETLQKAFKEPESIEQDIKDYLASSTSESESEITGSDENADDAIADDDSKVKSKQKKMQDRIAAYKSLLQSLEEKEKEKESKYDMEITWEPGLKEKTEKMVKDKLKSAPLTPFEE